MTGSTLSLSSSILNTLISFRWRPGRLSSTLNTLISFRWRPGTVAKREIRKLSRSTNLLFPKAPFSRVVREICQNKVPNGSEMRFTTNSMKAIQVLTTTPLSFM